MSTTTSVATSAASAASAARVMAPPTSSDRSRLPTPIACETPSPAAARRQVTSCSPVPEAADETDAPARDRVGEAERHAVQDRRPTVRAHHEAAALERLPLERDLGGQRHVVAEEHDVEPAAQRRPRFGSRVGAGYRHERQRRVGQGAQRRRSSVRGRAWASAATGRRAVERRLGGLARGVGRLRRCRR